jgi:hypothetical protein
LSLTSTQGHDAGRRVLLLAGCRDWKDLCGGGSVVDPVGRDGGTEGGERALTQTYPSRFDYCCCHPFGWPTTTSEVTLKRSSSISISRARPIGVIHVFHTDVQQHCVHIYCARLTVPWLSQLFSCQCVCLAPTACLCPCWGWGRGAQTTGQSRESCHRVYRLHPHPH